MATNKKNELDEEIRAWAEKAIENSSKGRGAELDYSEKSIVALDAILNEISNTAPSLSKKELQVRAQEYGCYLLMAAKNTCGGTFYWNDEFEQPMLIVGKSGACVALFTWNKIKERLMGDQKDNIVYFFEQFVQDATPPQAQGQIAYI